MATLPRVLAHTQFVSFLYFLLTSPPPNGTAVAVYIDTTKQGKLVAMTVQLLSYMF